MKYLAVLGRQPEISMAELEAIFPGARQIVANLAFFSTGPADTSPSPKFLLRKTFWGPLPVSSPVDVNRFGGILKFAVRLEEAPLKYLSSLPEGKITIGVSDYSVRASRKSASQEALKLKKILVRHGRSVRVVENKDVVLSTATSLHNGLNGKNERKVELIKVDDDWYRVIGVQDIELYAKRDQARPARDAKVGMLPPKLAQILINLCGPLEPGATILDPFCGTGVVLQEAILMGYQAYGTDISERMVEYAERNLKWLFSSRSCSRLSTEVVRLSSSRKDKQASLSLDSSDGLSRGSLRQAPRQSQCSENSHFQIPKDDTTIFCWQQPPKDPSANVFEVLTGNAMSFRWDQPIDAVACEGYLGKPFARIPTEMELKEQKQECGAIVMGFLKNLVEQVRKDTPVVIAAPAWLRENGKYERLDILDDISEMGYNVNNKTREGLLYHRDGQVVARDILILRKK